MVKKKVSQAPSSKISSSKAPATSSTTQTVNNSSILKSLFSPSRYRISLFASVIQGLDSQHLRIHETTTSRLKCEHAIGSKATINCLDWGYYGQIHRGQHDREPSKKRKRKGQVNGNGSHASSMDVVLAFGTSDSEINMYSIASAKVVQTLRGGHTHGIKAFKFAQEGKDQQGWSIGGDGRLLQWDLLKGTSLRSLVMPAQDAATLCPLTSAVLCASHIPYLLDLDSGQWTKFTASASPVHSIISSSSDSSYPFAFLTAFESNRCMVVFDVESKKSIGTLIAEDEILSIELYTADRRSGMIDEESPQPEHFLLTVNKDGALGLFPSPFAFNSPSTKENKNMKARIMQRTRKADALIKVVRPDKLHTTVPLLDASFQRNEIVMVCTEGGVGLVFHSIPWREEESGNMLIKGTTEIVKAKGEASIGAAVMKGVKDMGRSHVDESHAAVINGGDAKDKEMTMSQSEIISISSGEEDSESEDDITPKKIAEDSASSNEDISMEDAERVDSGQTQEPEQPRPVRSEDGMELEEPEGPEASRDVAEPSFGELLRANAPEPVDVQAAFAAPPQQVVAPTGERGLNLPSGMSLGTVLTQSLRTNDMDLLETCFHIKDFSIVRATIERLDSSLAAALLQRLAERLHSRPGRAGGLMVWIQWTLVAHGGYLAGQPELMKKLAALYQVVQDRANSLQSLLSLKGKLDMLEAQMNLRKSMQARPKALHGLEEDDEEAVIYVEGQEESQSESEHVDRIDSAPTNLIKHVEENDDGSQIESDEGEDDEDEDMPTTSNGIIQESSDSEEDGLINDEASSTDQDTDDDDVSLDGVDHESVDTSDSAASSAPQEPPAKRLPKAKLSNGLGKRSR